MINMEIILPGRKTPSINSPIQAYSIWEYDEVQERQTTKPPVWELIEDPSDSMVIGGRFDLAEIIDKITHEVFDCWTPGMQFRNIRTGKILLIYTHKYTAKHYGKAKLREKLKCKTMDKTDQLELEI